MRTYRLRIVVLPLMAAIGLMTFAATAQAAEELTLISRHLAILLRVENGEKEIENPFLEIINRPKASAAQVGSAILKIPSKNSEIRCEKATSSEGEVGNEFDTKLNPAGEELTAESESKLSAMGQIKIQFSKCKVFAENGAEIGACTKAFNEKNPEKIELEAAPSIKALILTFLHFHKSTILGEVLEHHIYIVRLTPLGGGTLFTTLKFGGTCALPEIAKITGSAATETSNTDAVKQAVSFDGATTAGQAVSKDAKTKLFFGANEAFIKSTFEFELENKTPFGVM